MGHLIWLLTNFAIGMLSNSIALLGTTKPLSVCLSVCPLLRKLKWNVES